MTTNHDQFIRRLQRAKRRWQVAAILTACSLVVVAALAFELNALLLSERERFAAAQDKIELAMHQTRMARDAARTARREADALKRLRHSLIDYDPRRDPGPFLFPTDQMYRILPGEHILPGEVMQPR